MVTKRSLILALWGLVVFAYLYQERGVWLFGLAAVSVVLPLSLAASRAWGARRGRIEFGLLRHPLRREVRGHLLQGLNIWLLCVLLGGVIAAGGTDRAQIEYSLSAGQFDVVIAAFAAGLVLLAGLAFVPRRRVYVATNVVVALLSGFLAFHLVQVSVPATDAVVLDSPLTGEWFVSNGGRSVLLNGHSPNESNAIDFQRLDVNGRTHTGGVDAPLADYPGFGSPVLAPADGRIVGVADGYADNPPGTNSDRANHVVMDIGGGRYVLMAHLKQGSVTVQVGDACGGASRSPRSGTTVIRASRTCTCRSRTPRQAWTPTAPTRWCSATSTSPGAVPGRGATAANSAPVTSSGHSANDDDDVEPRPIRRERRAASPLFNGFGGSRRRAVRCPEAVRPASCRAVPSRLRARYRGRGREEVGPSGMRFRRCRTVTARSGGCASSPRSGGLRPLDCPAALRAVRGRG